MLKISEATAIALHSLIYIAGKGDKVSSLKEIAEKFKISEHHLSKVLQRFVKEGVLTSIKGPNGGFSIVSKFKDMSFLDIYEIMEGKIGTHTCIFNSHSEGCENCIMSDLVKRTNNEFNKYMKEHKISDFSF